MVRDLERVQKSSKFPESAPAGEAVFYRTYSRRQSTGRESWLCIDGRRCLATSVLCCVNRAERSDQWLGLFCNCDGAAVVPLVSLHARKL